MANLLTLSISANPHLQPSTQSLLSVSPFALSKSASMCSGATPSRVLRGRNSLRSTSPWAPSINDEPPPALLCQYCRALTTTPYNCTCRAVVYCGPRCQVRDWESGHRDRCRAADGPPAVGCGVCGSVQDLVQCACRTVVYCGVHCQVRDFPRHRRECDWIRVRDGGGRRRGSAASRTSVSLSSESAGGGSDDCRAGSPDGRDGGDLGGSWSATDLRGEVGSLLVPKGAGVDLHPTPPLQPRPPGGDPKRRTSRDSGTGLPPFSGRRSSRGRSSQPP